MIFTIKPLISNYKMNSPIFHDGGAIAESISRNGALGDERFSFGGYEGESKNPHGNRSHLAEEGKIACYVRNRHNMSFGFARNQGFDIATGAYLVSTDNDILFRPGWMEWCKNILDKAGDKYLVTPLRTDRQHRNFRHWKKAITIDGNEYLVNTRAGSNCWMMKRSQYDHIGRFSQHRKAGSQWNNAFQDRGYLS